jgi:predicted O-methyltransferase YrrM
MRRSVTRPKVGWAHGSAQRARAACSTPVAASRSRYERYGVELPEPVQRAVALAERLGFPVMPEGRPAGYGGPPSACIPQVGRLLATLAASRPGGRLAEHGTGAGIGTAWLASGMAAGARLVSAEIDARLARAAAELFRERPDVEIREGDCLEVLADEAPFDLLFADAGARQLLDPSHWDALTQMVKVGGILVFDDLKPLELWPPEWGEQVDRKREFAFHNPRVVAAEVRTTPSEASLIVTRIR